MSNGGPASAQAVLNLLKQLGGRGTIRDIKGISTFSDRQIQNAICGRLEPAGCVIVIDQLRWAFVKDWEKTTSKKEPGQACLKVVVAPGRTIIRHGKGYISAGGQGRKG
jgi:hypothetical protein